MGGATRCRPFGWRRLTPAPTSVGAGSSDARLPAAAPAARLTRPAARRIFVRMPEIRVRCARRSRLAAPLHGVRELGLEAAGTELPGDVRDGRELRAAVCAQEQPLVGLGPRQQQLPSARRPGPPAEATRPREE